MINRSLRFWLKHPTNYFLLTISQNIGVQTTLQTNLMTINRSLGFWLKHPTNHFLLTISQTLGIWSNNFTNQSHDDQSKIGILVETPYKPFSLYNKPKFGDSVKQFYEPISWWSTEFWNLVGPPYESFPYDDKPNLGDSVEPVFKFTLWSIIWSLEGH